MNKGKKFISDLKFYSDYAKWREDGRYETWEEACESVMNTHRVKYSDKLNIIEPYIAEAEEAYKNKLVLASQRNLQFRGEQILKKNERLFNCVATYLDKIEVIHKSFFLSLCGCGVGINLQKHWTDKLPNILPRNKESIKNYIIPDSIEGWANAAGILISSYCDGEVPFPEYQNCIVRFDYSKIRPKGAFISGGFKAPGPDGLKKSLEKIEQLFENNVQNGKTKLRPIIAYDILMHLSDATLSGGIRRAAMLVIVDEKDQEMLNAKTGDWRYTNPQRGRSNNSVAMRRNDFTLDTFKDLVKMNNGMSDIGFFFTNNVYETPNPCITGDLRIDVSIDGKRVNTTVKDVVDLFEKGCSIEILSFDIEKNVAIYSPITNAWKTKENADVIKIIDNSTGSFVKVTPDHLIYTTNRGYIKANELKDDTLLKYNDYQKISGGYGITINENQKKEDVYDFTVPNTSNFFVNNILVHNCVEVNFTPILDIETEITGFQMCNLVEGNAKACMTNGSLDVNKFKKMCRAASIISTLQAGYTDFPYLGKITEEIVRKESLIGVGITGWFDNPELFDEDLLKEGVEIIKKTNEEVARLIGINLAGRTTVVKPSGNSSVILGCASGIHPEHSKRYFRNMQLNKETETGKWIENNNSDMIEESLWSSTNSDWIVSVPIENDGSSMFKEDIKEIEHLEKIKFVQKNWIKEGQNQENCILPTTHNNVSCTVIVEDYDKVAEYVFENQDHFTAVSFLSDFGDKDYPQAPFTSVYNSEELLEKYGDGVIFASGLITDGLHYFDNNLWDACDHVMNKDKKICGTRPEVLLKKDWVRRAKQFSKNYFKNDTQKMIYCLKDVHLWHKWNKITKSFKDVKFDEILSKPVYNDVDKYGAVACSGGSCEII